MSYTSGQIRLNYPNKVLSASVSSISGNEYWPHANGDGDQWYEGSSSKKYYRWEITFTVTAQQHGSHLTRDDFVYNGYDVQVGDWIAGATDGKCLKIISVSSKTATSVTCIVEDWLRYNTFKSTTGNGVFGTGAAVVFTLNEEGLPMLDPLPTSTGSDFFTLVHSRFQYLNPQLNYVLTQTNHGFVKGDVISATTDGFVKANSLSAGKMIGVVTEAGPGPDQFMILPNNRIIDFDPTIPGTQGEYVYVDSTGELSNTEGSTGKIAFLNIRSAVPTVLTGTVGNPVVANNTVVTFNDVDVTFTSNTANANLSQMSSQINDETSNHNIVSSIVPNPTVIVADADNTIYGQIGGYVPFSAYFNTGSGNTLVNFTTAGSVYANVATPEDMKADIDNANIGNLTVIATADTLTLREENGNAVTLINGNATPNGYTFVGNSNVSGLPATTDATGEQLLKLTRADGGEILIFENSPVFQTGTGIFSGHTGSVPLAMNIEQGVGRGTTTIVPTIAARDALIVSAGDQAYVTDKGNGDWGLFLYTGSEWVETSNADSATTDAKTLSVNFTMPTGLFGNSQTKDIGNISPGRKILHVSVEVDTVFSGYSGNIVPNVEVGTVADADIFVDDVSNDLTDNSSFVATPDYIYPDTETTDLELKVRCNHYGATAGNVTVVVTYV